MSIKASQLSLEIQKKILQKYVFWNNFEIPNLNFSSALKKYISNVKLRKIFVSRNLSANATKSIQCVVKIDDIIQSNLFITDML